MNYSKLFLLIFLLPPYSLYGQEKTITVNNNKLYAVTMIVQMYFDPHEIFTHGWSLCQQVWDDYNTEQRTYQKGTYQPIKNVCFQATVNPQGASIFIPVNTPDVLSKGFTVYIWDSKVEDRGKLFVRMNVPYGAKLQYPNDFFPI